MHLEQCTSTAVINLIQHTVSAQVNNITIFRCECNSQTDARTKLHLYSRSSATNASSNIYWVRRASRLMFPSSSLYCSTFCIRTIYVVCGLCRERIVCMKVVILLLSPYSTIGGSGFIVWIILSTQQISLEKQTKRSRVLNESNAVWQERMERLWNKCQRMKCALHTLHTLIRNAVREFNKPFDVYRVRVRERSVQISWSQQHILSNTF